MRKLINGIVDFRLKSIQEYRSKFAKLSLQQTPDTLFIACCDSRVVPNVFASSDPGDLFVLRNIGNLVPPYKSNSLVDTSVSAAVEFSLVSLKVSDIVICGHSDCGAMHTLMEHNVNPNPRSSLDKWLHNATPSYQRFQNSVFDNTDEITPCNMLSKINVLQQLDNLKTYPLIAQRLQSKDLRIHGWWFDLATANVYYYNTIQTKFLLINEEEAKIMLDAF